jgi:hypothetical protein
MIPPLLTFVALACGGHVPPNRTASDPVHVRSELGCAETLPSGEDECRARGCAWEAALACTGIPQPEEGEWRACACVCAADVERCSLLP